MYGIKIESQDHPYYRTARKVVHGLAETGDALTFFLDALPICNSSTRLPSPGLINDYSEVCATLGTWSGFQKKGA